MTQPPTPDSDRRDPLGFDEVLALLLAFSAIGGVLWWSMGRGTERWMSQLGATQVQVEATPGRQLRPTASPKAASGEAASEANMTQPIPTVSPVPEASAAPRVVAVPVPAVTAPAVTAPAVIVPVIPVAPVIPVIPVVPSPAIAPPVSQRPVIVIPTAGTQAAAFPDVPNGYWAYPFIAALSQRGLIAGVNGGTFKPDEPVNRAQYAALLSGVLRANQQGEIPFNDVPANFWGSQAIDEAVKSEFLKGYPDKSFKPEQPISKMQVLLSLADGFDLPQPADPTPALQALDNRDQIPDWARPAVAAAAQSNVVVSYPDVKQFQPNQPATRAEVAAMLYQALRTKGNLPPVQSVYILQP